jgi:site-specific DNA-methyltransferase (adenine-specific)
MKLNKIYNMDCLEGMKLISDKSIDMILCDLPYGTTACKWDTIIPFDKLWKQYERIIKYNGAIVLFGSQPFTSALVMSNPKLFKYEIIWQKNVPTGFYNAKTQQMKIHENILVFYDGKPTYNPQMVKRTEEEYKKSVRVNDSECNNPEIYNSGRKKLIRKTAEEQWYKYPTTVCQIDKDRKLDTKLHPTQKPIKLMESLIKTYTNENELILDNCIGSGTTAIASINTNRNYIGFELSKEYYDIANKRIQETIERC